MLRCSDVCVRGAGAERRMATQMSHRLMRSGRARGSVVGASVGSPLPGRQSRPLGMWIQKIGVRGLATDADSRQTYVDSRQESRSYVQRSKGWDGLKARNRSKYESRAQSNENEAELLLDIAKGATSPRAKRESDGTGSSGTIKKKVIEMEMKWLQDPKELADRVARLLKGGEPALAAALVRRAQTDGLRCGVAWHHLLGHCMNRNAPLAAFKFYNEMKKRGRQPDDRTYTIMLSGLSRVDKGRGIKPVETALAIYKSIKQPNVVQSNAMLNACARHGDMDTLWEVAGDLAEEGPGGPDMRTYTIILQAIRAIAQRDVDRMHPSQIDGMLERKAAAVREGKRIWADVALQWKKGQLEIDHFLVTAMGSLLVYGSSERDCYDVLALMNQTMGVPIFAIKPPDAPRGGASALSEEALREAKRRAPLFYAKNQEAGSLQGEDSEIPFEGQEEKQLGETQDEEEESFEGLFDPIIPVDIPVDTANKKKKDAASPAYIKPDNGILTLLLEACRLMSHGVGPGKEYWQHLTQEDHGYKIEPDAHSFHEYLRLLRVGRSSRLSLEVIRDQMIPANKVEGKTFHIAFSSCRRDRKNPNVLKIANEMLDLMESRFILPDPKILDDYVRLVDVLASQPLQLSSLNGLDIAQGSRSQDVLANTRDLQLQLQLLAISKLRPQVAKLLDAMENSRISKVATRGRSSGAIRDGSVVGFLALKALVRTRALIDEVLRPQYESKVPKSDRQLLEQETKRLRKYSSPTMVERFEETRVSPTREQVVEFQEREEERDMKEKRKQKKAEKAEEKVEEKAEKRAEKKAEANVEEKIEKKVEGKAEEDAKQEEGEQEKSEQQTVEQESPKESRPEGSP